MPTTDQDDEYNERFHRMKAQGVAKIKILIALLLGLATIAACIMAMLTENLR